MADCKIPKKRRPRAQGAQSCIIRVGVEQYQAIIDLCDESGRSITDVSSRLIEYALEHAEVVDKEVDT